MNGDLVNRQLDLEALNEVFEKQKPAEIVQWAAGEFSSTLAMTSSFGPESGVLLHLVSQVNPEIPVLFLETGYHFPETLEYRDALVKRFGLKKCVDLRADEAKRTALIQKHDGKPYEHDPDQCCHVNKVEPLDQALKQYSAWMTGIRRHQTDVRKTIRVLELYEGGRYKISPLANWTSRDTWWYLKEHAIPQHPLYEKGYLSIGCWPCTRPIQAGDDERSGRWAGRAKKECGIHLFQEIKRADDKEKTSAPDISADI